MAVSSVTKKIKCCEYYTRYCIHNTSFSLLFTNGPNRLEFYIALTPERLSVTNTLVCGALSSVTKKMKCEYDTRDHIHNTTFSS
jgi:hypothetical protein